MNFVAFIVGLLAIPISLLVYAIIHDLRNALGATLFILRCHWHHRKTQPYAQRPKWWAWPKVFVRGTWDEFWNGRGTTTGIDIHGAKSYTRRGWCGFTAY